MQCQTNLHVSLKLSLFKKIKLVPSRVGLGIQPSLVYLEPSPHLHTPFLNGNRNDVILKIPTLLINGVLVPDTSSCTHRTIFSILCRYK